MAAPFSCFLPATTAGKSSHLGLRDKGERKTSPASDVLCARPLKRVWPTLLAPWRAGPRRPRLSPSQSLLVAPPTRVLSPPYGGERGAQGCGQGVSTLVAVQGKKRGLRYKTKLLEDGLVDLRSVRVGAS